MRKIIAIGGGEIGRHGYPVETTKIDKEIIRLSGKRHPKLLFIPTASSDAEGYIKTVEKHFGKDLGCRVDTLLLVKSISSLRVTRKKILSTDIIYVGGGNTLAMLKIWRKFGVDKILRLAYRRGIVLSGLSAGAICWFRYGLSGSVKVQKERSTFSYIRVDGLGLMNFTISPHHIREKKRRVALIALLKKTGGVGIALDDYAALEIIGSKYRIISSKLTAKAHKVYIRKRKLYYEPLMGGKNFFLIRDLSQH